MPLAAWIYDLGERIFRGKISQERAELLAFLGNTNHKKLLEAGAGTCRFSAFLKRCFPYTEVYATDISREYLARGAKKADIETVLCPTEELIQRFPSSVFDIVLMVDALHHHADRIRALLNVFAVLKPGGMLVMREVDRDAPGFLKYKLIDKIDLLLSALQGLKYRAPEYFNTSELQTLLRLIGFCHVEVKPLGRDALILCKAVKPLPS
ncbi:MAG: class I SAM-dependent methyltransferase [Candidatus Bipolaricaulota bacterium]|nr:class I SAM-dependent methyltransferase [Candidatus Bipolaricaulota bacterium]MDW8127233.1 class I SAM-dependent methyltransferase [Candidatus Bipolaricaulota bacterium]